MAKKGENIYKRKDGRWEGRYAKKYKPDGKIQYGYVYGKSYQNVKEKLPLHRYEVCQKKIPPSGKKKKFCAFCDEWVTLNRNRVKESTYVKYINIVEKHIKPHLGGQYPQSLSSVLIEEFSHQLLTDGKSDDSGLAVKTVRDVLTVLKAIMKYTAKQTNLDIGNIDVIFPKDQYREMRVLSIEEQTILVNYLLSDMDACKLGILLALLTGIRIGEVCALRWKDIDLESGTIRVCATMQRLQNLSETSAEDGKTRVLISNPKSNSSVRMIPITNAAVDLCRRFFCGDSAAFALTGRSNKYMEPRTLQYRLKRYAEACHLEGIHFHTLRHTFATRCVEVDFEIKSLSEILGHSNAKVTLDRYVHSSLALKRANMQKLDVIGL